MSSSFRDEEEYRVVSTATIRCNASFQVASNLRLPSDQFVIRDVGRFEKLEKSLQTQVARIARFLVVESFGQDPESPTFEEDIRDFLSGGHLYLVTDCEKPIALRKHRLVDIDMNRVLLLMAAVTHPSYQRRGIMSGLIKQLIENIKPQFIALRTQSPLYYQIAEKLSKELFPSTHSEESIPSRIKEIGQTVARILGSLHFDPDTFVDIGTYGEATHAAHLRQISRYDHINMFFDSMLNYERGDSLLLVGTLENKGR